MDHSRMKTIIQMTRLMPKIKMEVISKDIILA
nr:MAG TPA: hypothetical protein [Caudoviricetes sp.]